MDNQSHPHARCCPRGSGMTRRDFMGAAALGCVAMSGLAWKRTTIAESIKGAPITRQPLKVKPVLVYSTPQRRPQTSWRSWGGIHDQAAADREAGRIRKELETLKSQGDFPVEFLPLAQIRGKGEVASLSDLSKSDVLLVYAAGGWLDTFDALHEAGKDMIFFCRHKSGPVYLWYEIISPRYLRQHTDTLAVRGIDDDDVVIDSQDEILWRLRSLCGLKNTLDSRIVAVGGPGAWAQPEGVVPDLVRKKWQLRHQDRLLRRVGQVDSGSPGGSGRVESGQNAGRGLPGLRNTTLETDRDFVDNAFLLDQVFRHILRGGGLPEHHHQLLHGHDHAPVRDHGLSAAEHAQRRRLPGLLRVGLRGDPLGRAAGQHLRQARLSQRSRPIRTTASSPWPTARRRAGWTASTMRAGAHPDPFRVGLRRRPQGGDAQGPECSPTSRPTSSPSAGWACRARSSTPPSCPSAARRSTSASPATATPWPKRMPGFHWMTGYGDYRRELGYALKRVGIQWDFLG